MTTFRRTARAGAVLGLASLALLSQTLADPAIQDGGWWIAPTRRLRPQR